MHIVEYQDIYEKQIKILISRIIKELGFPAHGSENPDSDLDEISTIYSGRGRFWVALENDKVVGTVGIKEVDQNTAKLKRMFVKKEYRGSGVAQDLLNTAQKFAVEQGYKNLTLWTSHVMKAAHRFYEKNGFVFQEENKFAKRFTKNLVL